MAHQPMNPAPHRWLSEGAETLVQELQSAADDEVHCEVLIVGSGYGGAVAAARLAGARLVGEPTRDEPARVWLLERGQEYVPGSFPSTFAELPGHIRFSMQDGKPPRGYAEGLFDLRVGGDVNVLLGNGLGGGSLINAAVMERATPDAFTVERPGDDGMPRRCWPAGIDLASLEPHYRKAEAMLEPKPIPGSVAKLDSLLAAGRAMHAFEQRKARIAVAFDSAPTPAGVAMQPCLKCGDCVSGCNHGAKQSLDVNYLAAAQANGARLFCGATVQRVQPCSGGYEIEFFFTDPTKARSDRSRPYSVRARRVILAAGTLGSTEILLRSRGAGLPVAEPALGTCFSGNGDLIAAAKGQREAAPCCAREGDAPARRDIGPTITGLVRYRAKGIARPIVFEEFGIPAPLRRLLGDVVATADAVQGAARIDWRCHAPDEATLDPMALSDDVLDHTPIYGMMGDDGAAGRIELVNHETPEASGHAERSGLGEANAHATDARVRITWPEAGHSAVFEAQIAALRSAHESFGGRGGRVLPNPLWKVLPGFKALDALAFRGPPTSVHPLGGCPMADDARHGVVDAFGRVWSDAGTVLPGLAVLDGSIVPVALGINPSLTIAALAERAIDVLAGDWQLELRAGDSAQQRPRPLRRDLGQPKAPAPTRILLREKMTGRVEVDGKAFDLAAIVEFATVDAASLQRQPHTVALPRVALSFTSADDDVVDASSASKAVCTGEARLFLRERSNVLGRMLRSLGVARRRLAARGGRLAGARHLLDALALCSHVGGVRTLEYDWLVTAADAGAPVAVGQRLRIVKRIAFSERGNPWRQLTEGQLERVEANGNGRDAGKHTPLGRLVLDPGWFVEQMAPLLSVQSQQDQPNALADLAQLAAWMARVVMRIHMLAFLPADDRTDGVATRLPGEVAGVRPERIEVPIDTPIDAATANRLGEPRQPDAKFLLSRYASPQADADARPVLLIHGYGAGGSTFAHPAIGINLVQSLLDAGREVWVLDLRTSIGLEQRRYWSFDEVAKSDIPRAFAKVIEHGGSRADGRIDVVAHCIGAAMFSVAVLGSSTLRSQVGAVVLSQVGPLLRMTALNRFRGYVSGYLRQFIGAEQFDSKPPAGASQAALLIDGALAAFPYPDDDVEAQRLAAVPGFAAVRHRADAIFGQTMQIENIGDEMLRSLDAIYGWVMVEGLAQTIHYAQERLLTDPSGLNRLVDAETLATRFDFPLLMLHGRKNALFDWRGSYDTVRLLKRVHDGVEWSEEPASASASAFASLSVFGEGSPRQLRLMENYGHQDSLIGHRAHRDVFPHIVAFLDAFRSQPVVLSARIRPPTLRWPAIGPMLGKVTRDRQNGDVACRIAVRPDPAHADVSALVFVPALRGDNGIGWRFLPTEAVVVPTTLDGLDDGAVEVALRAATLDRYAGFGVVLVDDEADELHDTTTLPQRDVADGLFAQPTSGLDAGLLEAVEAFLNSAAADLDAAMVRLDRRWLDAADAPEATPRKLCFALASCRYPPGLVDRRPARRTSERLAQRVVEAPPDERPQFMLLAGDQVYVDVSSGLFDPAGRNAVDDAYRLAFAEPAFAAVARSLPLYPLLADHEIRDCWEPESQRSPDRQYALDAYRRWQHSLVDAQRDPPFDYRMAPAGFPFFMLDVRSKRERRTLRATPGARPLARASIHAPNDIDDLLAWLKAAPPDRPKFIATSSPVFPLPLAALAEGDGERIGLDDWSGYPRSQFALLDLIRRERIEHVVLLSGGHHMSSVSSLWLEADGGPLEVVSIVSSGLYSPWPNTNDRPDDFLLDGPMTMTHEGRHLHGRMVTAATGNSDGFAIVEVERDANDGWALEVRLDLGDGVLACRRSIGVDGDRRWLVTACPQP